MSQVNEKRRAVRKTSKEFKSSRDSLKSRLKLKPIRYVRVARFGEKLFHGTTETKWKKKKKKKIKLNRKVFFLRFEFLDSFFRTDTGVLFLLKVISITIYLEYIVIF